VRVAQIGPNEAVAWCMTSMQETGWPFRRSIHSRVQGEPLFMTSSNLVGESIRPVPEPAHPETQSARAADAIRFYGTAWCGDCRRAKRVFEALGVGYTYFDIEQDQQATRLVTELNGGMRSVPTIVFPDGFVLTEPTNAELEAKLRALPSA
jgi:mycoredoxin